MSEREQPTMPVRAAAHVLGVHENTIRNYIRDGLLEAKELPSGFRRPYVDGVVAMISRPPAEDLQEVTAATLESQAAVLEQRAVALRRAAEIIREVP